MNLQVDSFSEESLFFEEGKSSYFQVRNLNSEPSFDKSPSKPIQKLPLSQDVYEDCFEEIDRKDEPISKIDDLERRIGPLNDSEAAFMEELEGMNMYELEDEYSEGEESEEEYSP